MAGKFDRDKAKHALEFEYTWASNGDENNRRIVTRYWDDFEEIDVYECEDSRETVRTDNLEAALDFLEFGKSIPISELI
jgi:hypothetical protein